MINVGPNINIAVVLVETRKQCKSFATFLKRLTFW